MQIVLGGMGGHVQACRSITLDISSGSELRAIWPAISQGDIASRF